MEYPAFHVSQGGVNRMLGANVACSWSLQSKNMCKRALLVNDEHFRPERSRPKGAKPIIATKRDRTISHLRANEDSSRESTNELPIRAGGAACRIQKFRE